MAAAAREGEANKAVRELLSDILKVPRSSVEVIKGQNQEKRLLRYLGLILAGMKKAALPKSESGCRSQPHEYRHKYIEPISPSAIAIRNHIRIP